MVNIDNKQAYYADSKAKDLVIDMDNRSDFADLNFYTGNISESGWGITQTFAENELKNMWTSQNPYSTDASKVLDLTYLNKANWLRVGFFLNITEPKDISDDEIVKMTIGLKFKNEDISWFKDPAEYKAKDFLVEDGNIGNPIYIDLPAMWDSGHGIVHKLSDIESIPTIRLGRFSSAPISVKYGVSRFFMFLYSEKPKPMTIDMYRRSYVDLKINPADVVIIVENEIPEITNENIVSESFSLTESLCSSDRVKFGLCESAHCEFEIAERNEDFSGLIINPKISVKGSENTEIPLGRFKVRSARASYVHNVKKTKIVAYDLLATTMEDNAFNWYTSYMTAYNTDKYTQRYGFEVARQIYSSYFNLAKYLGLESRDMYHETVLFDTTNTPWGWVDDSNRYFPIGTPEYDAPFVQFGAYEIAISSEMAGQRLVVDLYSNYTPQQIKQRMPRMYSCEPYGRGVTSGNIYIKEFRSGGKTDIFCVDSGDYFMIAPDTTKIWVYFAYSIGDGTGTPINAYADRIKVSKVNDQIDLTNGWIRLMYYDYATREIFSIDTTITARDVMRSLIEPCGAFFKLDRYGKTRFVYADKAGLYPSNKLYPADDLYPIKADFNQATMAHYSTFDYENYVVTNYGRIQIIKRDVDNSNRALVQWEHKGSDNRNTYLIDDNIFYSNPDLEYEFDSMPEVSEMLENMYMRIANLTYIPHYTKAIGLPFMETGDRLLLLTNTGGIESFIFRRTLKGINNLQDNYEAEGVQYTKAVSDYAYKEWR